MLVPVTTPFDPVTGDVDVVGLRANLRGLLEHPVAGIVMGGSTGEAVLLDDEERRALLEAARSVVPGERLLVAGTGAESTRATVRLTRVAADAGADAALVMPPSFYKRAMTPEALRDHYAAVADASPIPVILYQVPLHLNTLELPTGLVAELSRHENVVGIKDSRGVLEALGDLLDQCREGFQVLVGNGALLYAALEVGAAGGILAVANLVPGAAAGIVQAFRDGRPAEAGKLQERVGPLHKDIVGGMGIGGIKAALDLLGRHGGVPRPPLRPFPEKRMDELREVLRRGGLLEGVEAGGAASAG